MKPYSNDIQAITVHSLICIGLLWFLYTLLSPPVYEAAVSTDALSDTTAPEQPLVDRMQHTQKTKAQFAEIERRPLFYSTRRQVETARSVNSIEQYPSPDKKWTLTGTILTDQQSVAIFSAGGNNSQTLSDGMKLEGWTIEDIQVGQVTLRRQDQEVNMALKEEPAAKRTGRKNSSSIFVNKEQYHNRIVRPM